MCDFVLFCLIAVVSTCFLPVIYRRGVRYSWCPCLWLFTFFVFLFDCCTPFPPPSFYSAVWRTRCPRPCFVLLSGLSCTTYICIWLPFLPYAYYMWLPWFISLLFLGFPPPESFPGDDVLAGYFRASFLVSAFFPVCLSYFVLFFSRPCSSPICFGVNSSIL